MFFMDMFMGGFLSLMLMMSFSISPISLTLWLLWLSLLISLKFYFFCSWVTGILFLVYGGGLLILVLYVCSLGFQGKTEFLGMSLLFCSLFILFLDMKYYMENIGGGSMGIWGIYTELFVLSSLLFCLLTCLMFIGKNNGSFHL